MHRPSKQSCAGDSVVGAGLAGGVSVAEPSVGEVVCGAGGSPAGVPMVATGVVLG
jgi:hypothetical protein